MWVLVLNGCLLFFKKQTETLSRMPKDQENPPEKKIKIEKTAKNPTALQVRFERYCNLGNIVNNYFLVISQVTVFM